MAEQEKHQESQTRNAANHADNSTADETNVRETAQNSHAEENNESSIVHPGKDDVGTIPPQSSSPGAENSNTNTECAFRMEKPKLPKFSGDVRDYMIFKADFTANVTLSPC